MSEQHAAYAAAVERAGKKYARIAPKHRAASLTPSTRAALSELLQRDLPRIGARIETAETTDVGAVFFERARVLQIVSNVPFPAQTAYAALTETGPRVLSSHPATLAALCAEDPPTHVDDPDLALVLATQAGFWTGTSLLGDIQLRSIDDIPFRAAGDQDRQREAEVRRTYGDRIAPPGLEVIADGIRLTTWLVGESRLLQRIAEVRGTMVNVVETVVCPLPVHPGRLWGERAGRLVPTG